MTNTNTLFSRWFSLDSPKFNPPFSSGHGPSVVVLQHHLRLNALPLLHPSQCTVALDLHNAIGAECLRSLRRQRTAFMRDAPKTSRKYMEIYGNTIHVARILSWDLFIFFQSSSLQKARISLKNKCLKYGGCFDKRRRVLNKCSQVSNNPWKKSKKCSLSSQSFFWNVIHFPAAFDKPILHDVQPSKPEQSTFQNVRQFFWEKPIHAQYAMVFIRHIVFWNECCLPFYINVGHPSWKRNTYCWTNCSLLQHYLFSWAGAVLHPKRPALLLKLEKTSLSNFYKKFNL